MPIQCLLDSNTASYIIKGTIPLRLSCAMAWRAVVT